MTLETLCTAIHTCIWSQVWEWQRVNKQTFLPMVAMGGLVMNLVLLIVLGRVSKVPGLIMNPNMQNPQMPAARLAKVTTVAVCVLLCPLAV